MPRKASFRFEDHWLHTDGFSDVVEQAWSKQQSGSALTVLRKKLTETARALRQWSKPLFSKARLQLHIANEVIMRLEIAQERRHLSDGELALRKKTQTQGAWPGSSREIKEKASVQIHLVEGGGGRLHQVLPPKDEH